jgi:hypothetical protein
LDVWRTDSEEKLRADEKKVSEKANSRFSKRRPLNPKEEEDLIRRLSSPPNHRALATANTDLFSESTVDIVPIQKQMKTTTLNPGDIFTSKTTGMN